MFHKQLNIGEYWTPPPLITNESVIIEGPGQGLAFVTGPINITQDAQGSDWGINNPNRVALKGFTSLATSPNCGPAIKVHYPSIPSSSFKYLDVEDVEISGYNHTNYWTDAVDIKNSWFSSFKYLQYQHE
jgi:hypothetical protein